MHLLYPSDPSDRKQPDAAYAEEFRAAQAIGFEVLLFSFEDFEQGPFKPRPAIPAEAEILYRGWMLTVDHYARLHDAIEARGGRMVTTPEQYRHAHQLPGWYSRCAELTPRTLLFNPGDEMSAALAATGWARFFVKDFVKSLSTGRGSVARSIPEVLEIVALIERYRGQLEGGICVREYEDLLADTEERHFVFRGRAFSRSGQVPDLVTEVASRIASPFFSVDIVQNRQGQARLVEIGDGQVSDRKQWSADAFIRILRD